MKSFLPKAGSLVVSLLFIFNRASVDRVYAQQQRTTDDASPDIQKIIRAFTAKETEFSKALSEYAFKRDATIQTIGAGGEVRGEYIRVSQFVFTDQNQRFEKIPYFPAPPLTKLTFTQKDLEEL